MSEASDEPTPLGSHAEEPRASELAAEAEEPPSSASERAGVHVKDLRRRLLDLRNGNRLIHFPHASRGRNYVRAVDELPEVLHKKLVDGRSLRILALPEAASEGESAALGEPPLLPGDPVARAAELAGIDPSYALSERVQSEPRPRRHGDDAVQTLLFSELHQKTLARIADNTRLAQEEQGIHTLFAAFGFLEWHERRDPEQARYAPLLLFPLKLQRERKAALYEYAVSAHDEEAELNLALSERLWRDFGQRLPAWRDDDELGDYFARVRETIAAQPRWKLHRWVTISNFSFARISMYHDLDDEGWDVPPHAHLTFRALTTDRTLAQLARPPEDQAALASLADALPSLVLDADTTQVSAIVEAMHERSLVIKGPPGTGKSQTIANLIASALAAGQRVLFVAEKLAALEVVKARLDRAGLGEFCLELHSHRGTRKAVMETLASRLELKTAAPRLLAAQRERSAALRTQLNAHADALNRAHGALGFSVHELIWRREQFRGDVLPFVAALDKLRVTGFAELGLPELDQVQHLLRGFLQAAHDRRRAFVGQESSLWACLTSSNRDEDQLLTLLEQNTRTVGSLHQLLATALGAPLAGGLRLALVAPLCALAEDIPADAQLTAGLIENLRTPDARQTLGGALQTLRRRTALLQQLAESGRDLESAQQSLPALQQAARSLAGQPAQASLSEARALASERLALCDELTRAGARLASLAKLAGVEQTDDPESVLTVEAALAALDATSRELVRLLRVAPALAEDGAYRQLAKLAAEGAALHEQRAALDQHLVRGRHDDELRAHGATYALALRRPWWLAWLFGLFWAARSLHARVTRVPGQPLRTMADQLSEARHTLDALAAFEAHSDARALCGSAFCGVDSDFPQLLAAASWADSVRTSFARIHPAAAPVRSFLLHGELGQVDVFLQEAHRNSFEALWSLAARAQKREQTLSSTLHEERAHTLAALASLEQLSAAGLYDQLPLAAVASALDGVAELAAIDAELPSLARALSELGIPEDPRTLELGPHEVTLRAAELASERGIDLAVLAALAEPATRALLARLTLPRSELEQELAELREAGLSAAADRLLAESLTSALAMLEQALAARTLLRAQRRYLRERERAEDTFARPVVQAAVRGEVPLDKLVEASEFLLYGELLQQAAEAQPVLGKLNGSELESMRASYRELDRQILSLQAQSIASELCKVSVADGVASGKKSEWSELALIKHELSKKIRHVPLRQLMRRAGQALGTLKPCFMMSPLTVAQFLPQLTCQFDLVVIDEASQMRPEDALGAVVRGKRAVIVGDPKQLPPTSFFHRMESTDEDEPELLDGDEPIDQESILDLGVASFGDTRDLRWHYRSRHPSLIAFSNQHFYDGRLKVFPAPVDNRSTGGVQLVLCAGEYADSLNPLEAERIALGVQRHVRVNPKLTLGVVAMNQKQKELIRQKIDELKDEAVRTFVDASNLAQPFFVKSLENVQGDERDVIFVSLTYGPDPVTKKVRQNFGPINGPYGARRLNVLFTRARERLVVFSSLRPEDVHAREGASAGMITLRKYLAYAERGVLPEGSLAAPPAPHTFAGVVTDLLEKAGYSVVPRVGVQGFFVELGVKARDGDGFACGIECDGADYHAQRSVRDRDRLRHELLAAQGWQIVHVWSVDWFRAPEAARERLLAEVARHFL